MVNDVNAALGGPDVSFTVCRNGRAVTEAVARPHIPTSPCSTCRSARWAAMAVTMGLRLDESSGLLPHVQVLMLLDRRGRRAPGQALRRRGVADQAGRCADAEARPDG